MKIGKVMQTNVITVTPCTPVQEVARIIVRNHLRAVPVLDENGEVQGIITEEDLIYQLAYRIPQARIKILGEEIFLDDIFEATKAIKKKLSAKTAGELMNDTVISVSADADIKDAATIMLEKGVDSILVMDKEEVKGIVTRHDIVKSFAMENDAEEEIPESEEEGKE